VEPDILSASFRYRPLLHYLNSMLRECLVNYLLSEYNKNATALHSPFVAFVRISDNTMQFPSALKSRMSSGSAFMVVPSVS